MESQGVRCAPRGNPVQGGKCRQSTSESTSAPTSFLEMMRDDVVINNTTETLTTYIQRNVSYEVQKGQAIKIMVTSIAKWNCSIREAAQHAADCSGFSDVTIRQWASAFVTALTTCSEDDMSYDECIEEFLSSNRGGHDNHAYSLLHDEDFCLAARTYVRKHACRKGEPNLTSQMFSAWINTEYNVNIHDSTARRWLFKLGFSRIHHQKGVYFDGHDRDDVVKYRNTFLEKMGELDNKSLTCYGNRPELGAGERPLIRVVHDESTFYANSDQSFFWGDDQTNVLRQKSLGASIMVSDFIDEIAGYVRDNQEQARLLMETSREEYFTNDHLMDQVSKTVAIFERLHPEATGVFLFDNAPSHRKVADDALNADKMNVGPGGKQPKMRDTVWGGKVQKMVDDEDVPKGMRTVLQERGVDTTGMKAKDMRDILKTFPDFIGQKTILEDYNERQGHICILYPKFHCELSPIERVWCQAKKHTRAYADGTITRLRKVVPEGLDSVTIDQMEKFFKTCRDYERAYREGGSGREVEERVKLYKSHDECTECTRRVYRDNS